MTRDFPVFGSFGFRFCFGVPCLPSRFGRGQNLLDLRLQLEKIEHFAGNDLLLDFREAIAVPQLFDHLLRFDLVLLGQQ